MSTNDTTFAGSIPALYDRYMGPLVFAPYAEETAARLAYLRSGAVVETAAGTGIVTQALAKRLPEGVRIVATDLNQAMLDYAATKPGLERVTLEQADALKLPFVDQSFDALVCQFGVMFFPDRVAGYREARRVLKPGGRAVIAIWDSIETNALARCVNDTLARHFPSDPPRFMARTPHGHGDQTTIRRELGQGGFDQVAIDVVTFASRCASPHDAAIAYCQGTPLRGEIEARDPNGLKAVTEAAALAVAAEFGAGPIEAPMQALIVEARA